MICMSVLLPEPFSPTSSPGLTSSDAPRGTSIRRQRHGGPDRNVFATPSTASTGAIAALAMRGNRVERGAYGSRPAAAGQHTTFRVTGR